MKGLEATAKRIAKAAETARRERASRKAHDFYESLNPMQMRFVRAGKTHKFRHNEAANRVGKTSVFCMESSFHLTGDYPENWEGKRFLRPVTLVVLTESTRLQRESTQLQLLGPETDWGSGFIPKNAIVSAPVMRAGCPGVVDYVFVRHVTGGTSKLVFQSSEQSPGSLAGSVIDACQYDENVSIEHWSEINRGTTTCGGIMYGAYTPRLTTPLVEHVHELAKKHPEIMYLESGVTKFSDIQHMSEEEKKSFMLSIPEHERAARIEGKANFVGAGLVYPVNPSVFTIQPVDIGMDWMRLAGIDFGTVDGTAIVWIARRPIDGVLIVYDEFYMASTDMPVIVSNHDNGGVLYSYYRHIATAIIQRGNRIPVAWPHDGRKGDAVKRPLVQIYRDELGVNLVPNPVTVKDGSLEDQIAKVLDRLQSGKLLITANCVTLLKCIQTYQRDSEGKIKRKQNDHLLDAMRYAVAVFDKYSRAGVNDVELDETPSIIYNRYRPFTV